MDNRQILRECAENLALLTQLGLSIAVPPILCLYAASWFRDRFSLGLWVMGVALVVGVGGGVMSAWRLWDIVQRRREDRASQKKSKSGKPDDIGGEKHQD